MELFTLIASLILTISFLLAPTASDQLNLQKSLQQVDDHAKLAQLSLGRKLNLHEEITVKDSAEKDSISNKNLKEPLKDSKQDEKVVMNAAEKAGTWKESVEEEEEEKPHKSEYFTMDYGWVRRRRPIHNKQIPFVP